MKKIIVILLGMFLMVSIVNAAEIKINHNTQFVVDVKILNQVCIVDVIFTKTVSTKVAEEIVSSVMKYAIPFNNNYDILGAAWLLPNGNEWEEKAISFSKSRHLTIKKGTNKVIPFLY